MNLSTKVGFLILGVSALLSADTLTLRSGEVVEGTYLGGTAREIRMDLNGAIRTYDIGQIRVGDIFRPCLSGRHRRRRHRISRRGSQMAPVRWESPFRWIRRSPCA